MSCPALSSDGLLSFDLDAPLGNLMEQCPGTYFRFYIIILKIRSTISAIKGSVLSDIVNADKQTSLNKLSPALEYYLEAFTKDRQQPISSLCIGLFLVLLSGHYHVTDK